jgi:predicted adenylyl cyclase CyaB
MSDNKNIEVEVRAVFDESKYNDLLKYLATNAEDLGEDDKDVYFFLLPTKVTKVVNNISKGTAKIVAKLTRVGQGGNDTEEIEIFIDPKDFDSSVKLFTSLDFKEVQRSFQKRHNYMYKGVEVALKYSESWGYHMELEIMIVSKDDLIEAESQLKAVAEELGVKIMSPEEQKVFAENIDMQYKKNTKA